jgi:uncharacterized protein
MATKPSKLSPAARELRGALTVYLAPRMAADTKLPNIGDILRGAPKANRITQRTGIANAIQAAVAGKLAQDADVDDVIEVIEAAEKVIDDARMADGEGEEGEDMEANAAMPMVDGEDDDPDDDDEEVDDTEARDDADPMVAKVMDFCKGKMSPEDCSSLEKMMGEGMTAHDEMVAKKGKDAMPENMVDKKAMDSAITAALVANDAKHSGIAAALAKVRPSVGEIRAACDSAATVFRMALDAKGVGNKDVPDAGLEPLWDAYTKIPATRQATHAADSALPAGVGSFEDRFPSVRAA